MNVCSSLIVLALAGALPAGASSEITDASANLQPSPGRKIEGSVRFQKTGDAIAITGRISGLTPGKHGFHIHMFGDCSAPDFASAGDHFNPAFHDHGGPASQNRHVGDLGNVEAGPDGIVTVSLSDSTIALSGPNSILGRALVVHANADDEKSQPSGQAGPRLACGVIGVAPPR